jgi:hypothetical protein
MPDVNEEHALQMAPIQGDEAFETLRPHHPDPALRAGVGSVCPHRRTELPDGLAPEDLTVKGGEARELAAGAQRRSRSDHDPRSR